MTYTKHWQAPKKPKKNKPLDAPNLHRHQKNQKKTKFPATTQKWAHSSWKFWFFFGFFWCLSMFPQLSLWFFLVFFGACAGLVTLTSQNIDRHQKKQKKQTTRCTKPAQAPKKKKIPATTQKWAHSSWKFCFFWFFGACQCFLNFHFGFFGFFGACAGLVTLTSQNIDRHQKNQKKNQTTRCTKPAQAPKKTKKNKISSNYPEVGP